MKKLKNPLLVYIGFAIFFIVGVAFLVFGFKLLITALSYEKTTATVVSVRTYTNDEGHFMGVPTCEYFVNGERYEYEGYGRSVSICPLVGDTVSVRYNRDNPSQISDNTVLIVVFFIFGVIFGGVGGTMFVLTARGKIHWSKSSKYSYSYPIDDTESTESDDMTDEIDDIDDITDNIDGIEKFDDNGKEEIEQTEKFPPDILY